MSHDGGGPADREETIDLGEKDRIALPAVKVSFQAVMLQMAAAKEFGDANYARLDALTVSMAHPDGLAPRRRFSIASWRGRACAS